MNARPNFKKIKKRSPKSPLPFKLGVAAALLCVGAGLFLPVIKNRAGNHRVPSGQLRADTRTLLAAVHYLLQPEADPTTNPAPFDGKPAVFAQRAPDRPFEFSVNSSNQAGTNAEPATNPPARS